MNDTEHTTESTQGASMSEMPISLPPESSSVLGSPRVAILVLVLALMLGGLYLSVSLLPGDDVADVSVPRRHAVVIDQDVTAELGAVEAAVADDLSSLEKDLKDIDAAL